MMWIDILLVIIGAAVGFALSILTVYINKKIDKAGKIFVYYKIVYTKGTSSKAGIFQNDKPVLVIPLFFELQNTTNTTRVLRDCCLYLYNEGRYIAKMVQASHAITQKAGSVIKSEKEEHFFGGEKGTYSFVLPPLSIQRQECEFMYVFGSEDIVFDEIRFSYFDEKEQEQGCSFYKFSGKREDLSFTYTDEFKKLVCKKNEEGRISNE